VIGEKAQLARPDGRLEKRGRTPHLVWRAGSNRFGAKRDATLTLTPHSDVAAASKRRDPAVRDKTTDPLSQIIVGALEDAKAEDIVAIELAGKTTLADWMIVATGRSSVHVGAIADRVVKACRDAGYPTPKIEGMPLCDWVLIDARDTIVHVFRPDVRQFYNLEKMWSADRPGEARKK
jgi:ribosome-associated protein